MTPSSNACTLRGLIVGTLGCLVVGGGFQYTDLVLHVTAFATWFYTLGANIMLFLMALLVNPLLGLMRRSWMFTPAELAQMFVMWTVGSAVATTGFISYFLPEITTLAYYAGPENNWGELLLPFVPDWLIPSKEGELLKDFYEGRSDGSIPWALWLPALLHWVPFVLSLYVAMISIVVILRKQWIDHERLVFPMMQLPMAMIQDESTGARPSLIKPLFRNWLFWLGFALPFIVGINNGLGRYFPIDPIHVGGTYFYFFRDVVGLRMGINFMMVGFAYFIRRDVTLGLCFFYLLYVVYEIITTLQGGGEHDPMLSPWSRGASTFAYQGLGAFAALVGVGLWNSRAHLAHFVRHAVSQAKSSKEGDGVDDITEIMSYRAALIAAVGSLAFICFWMWRAGLPAWIVPLFVLIAFILYLGITRIIAESGIPWFVTPIIAADAVVGGVGTRALDTGGVIALSFSYPWASDMIILVMASVANGLKVVEETIRHRRRLIFWSMLIAIAVSLCSAAGLTLDVAYEHGGLNTSHYFRGQTLYPWEDAATRLATMTEPGWSYWGHAGLGALFMGLLMLARHRFVWWPFNPIGFPISLAADKMFISVLLAWAIKSAAIGYGGPRLYRKLRPFFLGLIMGEWMPRGVMALYEFIRLSH